MNDSVVAVATPMRTLNSLRHLLAARIIGVLDDRELTVRDAAALTGVAAADFARIRKTRPDHVTIDRLMTILNRLDQDIDVQITVRPRGEVADRPVAR